MTLHIHEQFLKHYHRGFVCLHPTDTIPGLTVNPLLPDSLKKIQEIKKRGHSKSYVGLVGSAEKAFYYWQDLSPMWRSLLGQIWPASLTVIWRASRNAPEALVNLIDQTIALRVPVLDAKHEWFKRVLDEVEGPLPSTSVNRSGAEPILKWNEAKAFLLGEESIFIPESESVDSSTRSSTLIRIMGDHSYETLRSGPYSIDVLEEKIKEWRAAHESILQ